MCRGHLTARLRSLPRRRISLRTEHHINRKLGHSTQCPSRLTLEVLRPQRPRPLATAVRRRIPLPTRHRFLVKPATRPSRLRPRTMATLPKGPIRTASRRRRPSPIPAWPLSAPRGPLPATPIRRPRRTPPHPTATREVPTPPRVATRRLPRLTCPATAVTPLQRQAITPPADTRVRLPTPLIPAHRSTRLRLAPAAVVLPAPTAATPLPPARMEPPTVVRNQSGKHTGGISAARSCFRTIPRFDPRSRPRLPRS
jgi:hypothetical protein